MRYIQLSGGLSELEIEDILLLDDEVLQAVFVHYLPPMSLFRLPSNLWIRIRNDMHKYLVEKDIDDVPCIYFYHRSFQYYQPMDVKQLIVDNQEKVILEKNRLTYFSNQYNSTFDMSYSSKLIKKYNLPSTIISVNRCLTEQKPLQQSHHQQYNLRRLHQLCINLNRYDFAHSSTIFNYDFLLTYLLCREFQMSDLLYEFSIGAIDPEGELRFLLKQYESSLTILNQYPTNLPFELIYHFYPFIDQLPELTYNLLVECINHCPLQLLTDNERQQSLVEHFLSDITCLNIDQHRLFVLTSNDQLYIYSHGYYGLLRTGYFDISYKKRRGKERLISFLCRYLYVCCLSSNLSMITLNYQEKQMIMQMPCGKLVSFIDDEHILIISSTNDSLEIWNCSKNLLVSAYDFPDNSIDNCIYRKSIIKVILKRNESLFHLTIDQDYHFQLHRIVNEKIQNYTYQILLNNHAEFYYSFQSSKAILLISHENQSNQMIDNIDFLCVPIAVFYLSQSESIAWLTRTSLLICHPIYDEKLFKPFNLLSTNDPVEYSIYKYNATMLTYLSQSISRVPSFTVHQIPNIYFDKYLTFTDNEHYFKILTLNETTNTFDLHLSVHAIKQYYFTPNSSHILFINRKNIVSIYSLKSTKLLWTSNEFEHRILQVHSLQSSFLLICLQTKQIFHIDTISFKMLSLQQLPIECCLTTFTSDNRLFALSKDQKSLVEFNVNNQQMKIIPSIPFHSVKIIEMHSVCDYVIFRTEDDQTFLWWNETKPMVQFESTERSLIKNKRLIFISTNKKTIIIYDLHKQVRQNIQIDNEILDLCIRNENSEEYLFVICHDQLLRMYEISNGKEIVKLFIHKDVKPFIGIIHNRLLIKVANYLCIIKILDRNSLPSK
ncbi:hypothetical protein I4U23_024506 [Adineta vaga]|nr:hypothetical protein I4U23_024506 [Adineta vaga]